MSTSAAAGVGPSGRCEAAAAVTAGLVAGRMIGVLLEYNSYVVFSTTTNPKGTTISVGALGQVFVVVDVDDRRKK